MTPTRRTILSAAVRTGNQPRPSTTLAPTDGIVDPSPSIWKPLQMPSTSAPLA